MSEQSANDAMADEEVATDDVPSIPQSAAEPGEADIAAERDLYRDTLQRLQADFENYRKRVLKQQSESAERATESLIQKLLPVLDTLELAKAHEPNGSLEQVSSSLLEVLNKEGLERIISVDQPFDPTLHEAVAHEPGDDGPVVSEEMRSGYRWKGRVVRPAMVKVTG